MEEKANHSLPAFLVKPNDEFSKKHFGKDMVTVKNQKCGYRVEIYSGAADIEPQIKKIGNPGGIDLGTLGGYKIEVHFDAADKEPQINNITKPGETIDEVHIYAKEGSSSWYVIHTLKTPSVRTTSLLQYVFLPYNLSKMFNTPETFISIPIGKSYDGYENIQLEYMGIYKEYAVQKGLDESHVFCHVFRLGDRMYKDFILCARKDDCSWKLETIVPTKQQEILSSDFVPAGYFFGSFQLW